MTSPPMAPTAPDTFERVNSYGDAIRARQRGDGGLIDVWDTAQTHGAELLGGRCQRRADHDGDCAPEPTSLDALVLTPREARELAAWLFARTGPLGGAS